MDRLITPLESDRAYKSGEDFEDSITQVCLAQDIKTHQATLKEVGEWLQDHCVVRRYSNRPFEIIYIKPTELDAFKRGEMPEC